MAYSFWKRRESAPAAGEPLAPEGVRIYAVGDVHGCIRQLDELLAKIEAHVRASPPAQTFLVFLGDYVDRGPDSYGVLDRLAEGVPFVSECVFLMGNHEETLLEFFDDPGVAAAWRQYGGMETLASYKVDVRGVRVGRGFEEARDELAAVFPQRHREFLESLELSCAIGGYFFCHAGVRPGVSLERQSARDLMWIREAFLDSKANFGKVVVHGHTPRPDAEFLANRINVDTGAYMTGRLTCAVLEGNSVSMISTGAAPVGGGR